mgnify:CR=1 FL=1|jgi:hypothetical protein
MTITAKYQGRCTKCGGRINIGDKIEWERGKGSHHVECPDNPEPVETKTQNPKQMKSKFDSKCIRCGLKITAGEDIFYQRGKGAWHTDCAAVKEQVEKEQAARKAEAPYMVTRGSGYGGDSFIKGQVIRAPKNITKKGGPTYLYVVRTDEQYFKYDGLSFGVGDESGYVYRADCRAATAEEAAPVQLAEQQAAEKKKALAELDGIKKDVQTTGERPEGDNTPEGKRLIDTQTAYGGGDWFVIGQKYIWYIQNNGGDGDDWSVNNVLTGGAGAIGWRVPYKGELAERIERIAGIVEIEG